MVSLVSKKFEGKCEEKKLEKKSKSKKKNEIEEK